MTPSPTPTPTSRLARFILEEYGVGEVMVLVDIYGRILTEYDSDGNFRTAVVWVPGDSRIDWDSASDTELVALLNKYGYNDALTIDAGTKNVLISTNDETETLVWDDTEMDFTVDFDQWQNGTANMFYRTVEVDNQDVTVLCDADGKAIRAPFGEYDTALFQVGNNGTEIDSITVGSSIAIDDVITACGGATDVTNLNGGDVIELLVNGNYVLYINADNSSVTPEINSLSIAVEGAIQIFKNELCSEYADGSEVDVYLRFNRNFGYGQSKTWGTMDVAKNYLDITCPDEIDPQIPYEITLWVDFEVHSQNEPFAAAAVVHLHNNSGVTYNNPTVIFSD